MTVGESDATMRAASAQNPSPLPQGHTGPAHNADLAAQNEFWRDNERDQARGDE